MKRKKYKYLIHFQGNKFHINYLQGIPNMCYNKNYNIKLICSEV